jgi:hypothetical protein
MGQFSNGTTRSLATGEIKFINGPSHSTPPPSFIESRTPAPEQTSPPPQSSVHEAQSAAQRSAASARFPRPHLRTYIPGGTEQLMQITRASPRVPAAATSQSHPRTVAVHAQPDRRAPGRGGIGGGGEGVARVYETRRTTRSSRCGRRPGARGGA